MSGLRQGCTNFSEPIEKHTRSDLGGINRAEFFDIGNPPNLGLDGFEPKNIIKLNAFHVLTHALLGLDTQIQRNIE